MFRLILTLVYIIPNVYLFFRILFLFIGKGYRLTYSIIYLMLASLFPLTIGSYGEMYFLMNILSVISWYLLPVYLYLFLSILVFDIFLLFNLVFRFVSREKRKSFSFRLYTFLVMIILSVLIVIGGIINLNTIRVSQYRIEVPRRQARPDHLRVAFVSDLHLQRNLRPEFVEQFVRKVNALRPDLMLYGGDMVEGDDENESTERIESALRSVVTPYGSYGVLGNHEFYGGQERGSFFRKSGIILLNDTAIRVDDSFYLAGRVDQHFVNRKSLEEIFGNLPHDLPVIVMDHRPIGLQAVSHTITDVQFSGHTHNGQLFPINLIERHIYELCWGYRKIGHTHFFVTSGLRLWGPPVKTAGKSEIMLVDIDLK